MRARVLLLLVSIGTAACTGLPRAPRNPVVLERGWGIASGRSDAQAERIAAAVEEARGVFAALPGFVDRAVAVHAVAGPLPWDSVGITLEPRRGEPWIEVEDTGESVPFVVAHELAHVYFAGLSAALPQLLEEGLCDLLAARVFEDRSLHQARLGTAAVSYLDSFTLSIRGAGAKRYLRYLVQEVPTVEEALELDSDDFLRSEARAKDAFYGLGWTLATCIGFEEIVALVGRARGAGLERVPPAWVLAAAGLDPLTPEALNRAFARAIGLPPSQWSSAPVLTLEMER